MKLATVLLVLILATLALPAQADDLGLLRLSSQAQVEVAQNTLGHAYAKIDDRFLVLAGEAQQEALASAGLSFAAVIRSADLRSLYLVHPRQPQTTLDAVDQIGTATRLNENVAVVDASASAASSVRDKGDYFVVPLADREVTFHYLPPMSAHPMDPTDVYPTDTLAGKVSRDSLYAYDTRLENFQTRYIYTDSCLRARDWLKTKLQSFGYTNVTTPSFYYGGGYFYNVKAVKPGYAEPDKVIVVGGHYDSWNQNSPGPMTYAPGADDDASGTAVTLEIARILAQMPLRKTVVFMPFSAEEVGLVGSRAAALDFKNTGTNVEAMYNYDMVAFTQSNPWRISLSSGPNTSYRMVSEAAANRLTSLVPLVTGMGSSSDHYSFFEQGFNVCDNIETDFNTAGWHTNLDLSSRMNFDYFTEVVKMAVASIAIVANSATPINITKAVDQGDGQQIEVFWDNCLLGSEYQYTLYWGTYTGVYTDSVQVPYGQCSYMVSGLTEYTPYYFAVYAKPPDGYRGITAGEGFQTPLTVPRPPRMPMAEPGNRKVTVAWMPNLEADFAYYNIYRKLHGSGSYDLLASHLTDTVYNDSMVASNVMYDYTITAVDNSALESDQSVSVSSYPGTFDGGILLVDEFTQDYDQFPTEEHQYAYWDTLFAGTSYISQRIELAPAKLDKGTAGRFSSIFWMDDDANNKIIKDSDPTLKWYAGFSTDMFVTGYKTIQNWCPTTTVPTSHTLYNEFRISSYSFSSTDRFVGGVGQNGWPSLVLDATRGFPRLGNVPVLTVRSGGTVICTYDSYANDPALEGKPCGVAYDGPTGKHVILSFPLYYMTPASAVEFMAKVKTYFGEGALTVRPGDINGTGVVDLVDLSIEIAYLTGQHPVMLYPNGADVDSSCFVNLVDLSIMISYLTRGYPGLLQGCVQP